MLDCSILFSRWRVAAILVLGLISGFPCVSAETLELGRVSNKTARMGLLKLMSLEL